MRLESSIPKERDPSPTVVDPGGRLDLDERTAVAVAQCKEQIHWFETHSRADWYLYRSFQVGIIVLSSATPVLLLFTSLPKPLQALPAAMAALGAAVAAGFHWHEDAVRWAATREQLKSELRQFNTRAGQYRSSLPRAQALDNFVTRVEAIILGELSNWQRLEQKPETATQPNKE
jgi:hypothetical protein